jgi:tol-pal system protein YbgF
MILSRRWKKSWMNVTAIICLTMTFLAFGGCSGSEELLQQQAQKISDYEKQVEELRTENTTLRQRMVKLEQDNKTLEARLSESEVKVMMERERADKAEAELAAMKTPPARTPSTSKGGYDEALGAAFAKRYDEAIAKFEALLGTIGDGFADNCHYWIGECQYARKRYQEAIKHFEMVMNYARSEKLADAHFMMAQSYERLGDKAKAKEHYQKVVKNYPTSPHVALAKQRAEKM